MPLFALTNLSLPGQRPLLKLLDPHQPPSDLIAILLARLAQLVDLRQHLTQRLAALLNLDQGAGDLFTKYGDIAPIAIQRLRDLLPIAIEQSFRLCGSGLDFANLLHGPAVFIGLILDQPAHLIDLPLQIHNL